MSKQLEQALAAARNSHVVRELLDRTATDPDFEGTKLSTLVGAHLVAFAGTDQALLDAPVREAWTSLTSMRKWQIRRLAMRTKALRWTEDGNGEGDGDQPVGPHPYVGLIMAARINPRFVLTLGNRGAARGVRVFAIDNGRDATDCYVMEEPDFSRADQHASLSPLDWYYRYWLLARPFLATYLANYAAVPNDEDSEFAGQPRVMSLYRPPVTDKSMVASLEVYGAGETAKVVRRGPGASGDGAPVDMAVEELATIVSEMLAA